MQGVRIDYVLVSPGLLARMGKCEIISTPSKWSDHAALLVTVKDVIPPEPHNPVPQSSKRMKRFDTRSQPTIASMFARRSGKVMTAGAKITDPGTASALQPNADNAVDQTGEPSTFDGPVEYQEQTYRFLSWICAWYPDPPTDQSLTNAET